MRYKLSLKYDGTNYAGWQRQDNAISIQEVIEDKISTRLQQKISVVGCGRTDAGVHASDYVLHFDAILLDKNVFLHGVNRMLPDDIAFLDVNEVSPGFHARFDAVGRSYVYRIHTKKNPFKNRFSYYFPPLLKANKDKMNQMAKLISNFDQFEPFCKAHSDVKTKYCQITESSWNFDLQNDIIEYHISADRFLRGMVRLIVGAGLQIGLGKMTLAEVEDSLSAQKTLSMPLSVPPEGLFLSEIKY